MTGETRESTLPVRVGDDGFDEQSVATDRVIQGALLKCIDGHWQDRDGLPIPPEARCLVLATTTIIQLWREQLPVETIVKQTGKPLPNIDELNAQIPAEDWEEGIDGNLRPPWQKQEVVYLLDTATAEKYTFASGTIGGGIAVDDLRDRVRWMRALRGQANVA